MKNYYFDRTFSNVFDVVFNELAPTKTKSMSYYNQAKAKEMSENLALPGLTKSDLIIDVKDKVLTVKTKSSDYEGYLKRYNDFVYRCILMDDHDEKNIAATMENGLLTINVPLKKEKDKNSIVVPIK